MAGFPCIRCGECCKRVTMKPAGLEHLCGPDPEGTCVHYVAGSGCAIYETRPPNCRVEHVYYTHPFNFAAKMPLSVYYGVSKALCHDLQRAASKRKKQTP
jgi:Fe-S-cluster containining protein